jgi:biotin carboxyl carrier protein
MPRYFVVVDGREYDVEVNYGADRYDVSVNGRRHQIQSHQLGESRSLLLIDSHSLEVDVRPNGDGDMIVFMKGMEIPVSVEDYNLAQIRKAAGLSSGPAVESVFKAPMPGLVIDVRVRPGQKVRKGDPLLVIEAMKMENIIKAKGEAIVKATHVSGGQSVEKGDPLLEFE